MAEGEIVVDTSALMAMQDEPDAQRCIDAIASADRLLISAGTLAEAHIVAERRYARPALEQLLGRIKTEGVGCCLNMQFLES